MKIITHNDRFHADDVCAMAVLRIHFKDAITEVIRTRDESIIQTGDIVFDVGNVYDAEKNRFDHHQSEGAGTRANGIPYAAFGLVWKKFGAQICGSQEIADLIDQKLVQVIDAGDNGFPICTYVLPDVKDYGIHNICNVFGATWKEEDNFDTVFFEVVEIIEKILKREIKVAQDKIEAGPLVEKYYNESEDKRIVILNEYYPWKEFLPKYADILYVISPSKNSNQWRVECVQEEGFVNRKDLPVQWGGLRSEELEKVSGVEGAVFCHRKLFMAAANSKESAVKLAKRALES